MSRLFRLYGLREMGDLPELTRLVEIYDRDARHRGDRYMATTLRSGFNIVWLARSGPDEAERQLRAATWFPPDEGFHLQHWYELRALAEIALYRGTAGEDLPALAPRFSELLRSGVAGAIQAVRAEAAWLWARLVIARNRELAEPGADRRLLRRLDRRLRREHDRAYCRAWSAMLRASLAALGGRRDEAAGHLEQAATTAEASSMKLYAATARLRLAELGLDVAGDRRGLEASRWMEENSYRDPRRIADIYLPGFSPGGRSET